ALRYAQQAGDYATSHEQLIIASYAATVIAWVQLRDCECDEAERLTRREIESGMTVRLLTKTVLAELAVRRGDDDAAARLAEAVAADDSTDETPRIAPALELEVEHALTAGTPMPRERFETIVAEL